MGVDPSLGIIFCSWVLLLGISVFVLIIVSAEVRPRGVVDRSLASVVGGYVVIFALLAG